MCRPPPRPWVPLRRFEVDGADLAQRVPCNALAPRVPPPWRRMGKRIVKFGNIHTRNPAQRVQIRQRARAFPDPATPLATTARLAAAFAPAWLGRRAAVLRAHEQGEQRLRIKRRERDDRRLRLVAPEEGAAQRRMLLLTVLAAPGLRREVRAPAHVGVQHALGRTRGGGATCSARQDVPCEDTESSLLCTSTVQSGSVELSSVSRKWVSRFRQLGSSESSFPTFWCSLDGIVNDHVARRVSRGVPDHVTAGTLLLRRLERDGSA